MTACILWPWRHYDFARSTVATTYQLRVEVDGVVETLVTPTLTAGRNYWPSGDDVADTDGGVGGVGDAIKWFLEDTIADHSSIVGGEEVEVTVDENNIVTIGWSIGSRILWGDALTTVDSTLFGFAQSDPSASTSQVGATQSYGAWCPRRLPTTDTRPRAQIAVAAAVSLSGLQRTSNLGTRLSTRDLTFDQLLRRFALSEYADASEPTGTAEDMWREALSLGRPVRYYVDASARASEDDYRLYLLRAEEAQMGRESLIERSQRSRTRWSVTLPLRTYADG